jgi:hypothetical protein
MSKVVPVLSKSGGQDASKSEKRRSRRHACSLRASWRSLGAPDFRFVQATVQDISCHGFALLVQVECKKGAILSVRFESDAEKFAGPWLGQVVNARRGDAGTWILGCNFCSEFSEADLEAILRLSGQPIGAKSEPVPTRAPGSVKPAEAPAGPSPQKERRASQRRACKRVAVVVALPNGKRYFGRVINACANGIAVVMPRALQVGTIVKVRATNVSIGAPWASMQVRHFQSTNHESVVGCQFADKQSASLLETFCPPSG